MKLDFPAASHRDFIIARARRGTRTKSFKNAFILVAFITIVSVPSWSINPSLTQALNSISDPKLSVCLPAIEQLGNSHDGDVVPALTQALGQEKRPTVRRYLVEALGRLRSPDAVPALTQALSDQDFQVRQSAVVALELVGGDDSPEILVNQATQEQDSRVKTYLIRALGRSKHPKADQALKTLAQDQDQELQKMAQEELGKRAQQKLISRNSTEESVEK
jgi:HEAT repeat protein